MYNLLLILLTIYWTGLVCSALAAFYTRNFAEKFPDIKPPLLQVTSCASSMVLTVCDFISKLRVWQHFIYDNKYY